MSRASGQAQARVGARARQRGLVRGLLLFVAGLLAGANLLYFMLVRQSGVSRATTAAASSGMAGEETAVPTASNAHPSAAGTPAAKGAALPPVTTADAGAAAVSGPARPSPTPPSSSVSAAARSPHEALAPHPLLIPVRGVVANQLQDTFNDARAQGRSHEAIDVMAPAGTPVLAVADGTVEKLFTSVAGGLTVYQFEPSGRYAYYYAHLQGYAPGLAEKQALRRGDVIGYVGSTGNADPAAPHLHFAVFELGPERRWWQGTAINPYPLLHRQ